MRESELLEHIYARSLAAGGSVIVGPGDDTAVVRVGDADLLLTVDQLISGRHFPAVTPIDLIARKAIARAVSDIAAMGGTPISALAAAALPDDFTEADALFDAMQRWAEHFQCPLVGGDIAVVAASAPLALTVTIIGTAHETRGPVLRSTARVGDDVFVTGRLGGSLGSGRHLRFTPRLAEGRWLCDALGDRLHAMIDLSDGLGIDAGRVAKASGVRIELDADALPMHADVADWRRAIGDGEDYELCFTAEGSVPASCEETGTPMTRVGRVVAGEGCVIHADATIIDASTTGWDHGS